ncbi:MAG: hypothetical protein Q9183_006954, partial [Haloplaca sp. 2 TL-2023]
MADAGELLRVGDQKMTDLALSKDVDHVNTSDAGSVASDDSEVSVMEPFDDYKIRIEKVLRNVGLEGYEVEVIQHGYDFMNCVYGLSSSNLDEQYILRVATGGCAREEDGVYETVENEVVLLGHLKDKLPVPRIKAYSLTAVNPLEAAYTVQTRIPGESLNRIWGSMDIADKYTIVDELLDLLVKLESVTFTTA